jgi:hypothetical protein
MYTASIPASYVPCMPYAWPCDVDRIWPTLPGGRVGTHAAHEQPPGAGNQPTTLGVELLEIRRQAIVEGMRLLTPDEVLAEMRERRGNINGDR